MSITIATATASYTDDMADFREVPIVNASTVTTIGGVLRSQADTRRRQFNVRHALDNAQVVALESVINDFSAELTLTVSRAAYGDTTAQSYTVVASAPEITQRVWNGKVIYYISITYDEVVA